MKIAITGHTSGIGAAFAAALTHAGHDIHGFSRTTGHDVALISTAHDIIDADPEVLINVVWTSEDPWAQYRVQDLFARSLANRTIISIGTRATDWGIGCQYPMYDGAKEAVHKQMRWLTLNSSHRVLLVRPGLVDVPRFATRDKPKLQPTELVQFVTEWLDGPSYMEHISEVVFSPEMTEGDNDLFYKRSAVCS